MYHYLEFNDQRQVVGKHDLPFPKYNLPSHWLEISQEKAGYIDANLFYKKFYITSLGELAEDLNIEEIISSYSESFNQLCTTRISQGFTFQGYTFSCTPYDQQNITTLALSKGGSYKTDNQGVISLDESTSLELLKAMKAHIDQHLNYHWIMKNKLKAVTTEEEAQLLLKEYQNYQNSKD